MYKFLVVEYMAKLEQVLRHRVVAECLEYKTGQPIKSFLSSVLASTSKRLQEKEKTRYHLKFEPTVCFNAVDL